MLQKFVQPQSPTLAETHQASAILICLLGSFRLLHQDQQLDFMIAGKAMALLSTLALHLESGVPREALLETLWPEQDVSQSTVSLNSLVYSLHRRLRDDAQDATAVVYANGSYYLNRKAGFNTDIACFDALVDRGNWLVSAGRESAAFDAYRQAIGFYRGDLSAGSDVYAVIERERLRARFLTVLARLADCAYRDGDFLAAMDYALRLLAFDPCREDAHRMVMRAHVHRGERAQALRQYRLCENVLRREFDAPPEATTTELFDQIRVDPASV
jgi:DNA-binding SARP family transcriptional activator